MAETAIVPTNVTAIAQASDLFSDQRIEMIRNSVAKGAPDDVFLAMIDIARRRNLDPLAKQIICAKFGSTWQMIVTIDGYRSIAEQTGAYAGSDAPVFTWYDPAVVTKAKKLVPESATVTVWKLMNGQRYPFSAAVFWEEFNAGMNNWVSMPRVMLAKVAESHALRKAFPAVLSGTYTPEEMDQAVIESEGRYVDQGSGEITPTRPAHGLERAGSGPARATASVSPPRNAAARPEGSQGAKRAAYGSTEGKAIHFRGKIVDRLSSAGWSPTEVDTLADRDFGTGIDGLSADDAQTLWRDIEELTPEELEAIRTSLGTSEPN